jgi:hypothetical protein
LAIRIKVSVETRDLQSRSSGSQLSPNPRRILEAIENLQEEREPALTGLHDTGALAKLSAEEAAHVES